MNSLRTYSPGSMDQGYNRRWAYPSPIGGLGSLGDDFQRGSESTLIDELFDDIIKKADPNATSYGTTLAGSFNRARVTAATGMAGNLGDAQQKNWNKFADWANGDEPTIWWAWVFNITSYGQALSKVAFNAGQAWITDPKEAANVLLIASGSGLTDRQWYELANDVFGWCIKQAIAGLINLNYLAAAVSGILRMDPTNRKFPVWYPPASVDQTDPLAKASWQAFLSASGWANIVQKWARFSSQTWAAQTAANDQYLSLLGLIRSTLSYVSGEVVLQKIQQALADYQEQREGAITSIKGFAAYLTNPATKDMLTEDQISAMKAAEQAFINTDTSAAKHLTKAGAADLGPSGASALQGLGWIQMAIAATVGVALLGTLAWLVNRMTETNHAATKVYEEASKLVTDNISKMTSSCDRDRAEGKITEEEYRACIERSNALVASLPKPPESALSSLTKTLMVVGVVGLGALFLLKRKA